MKIVKHATSMTKLCQLLEFKLKNVSEPNTMIFMLGKLEKLTWPVEAKKGLKAMNSQNLAVSMLRDHSLWISLIAYHKHDMPNDINKLVTGYFVSNRAWNLDSAGKYPKF